MEQAEKRSALLARIAAGESVGDGEGDGSGQQRVLRNFKGAAGEGDNDDKYGSMEYRKAFMRYVCRGEAIPAEYRADAVSKSNRRRRNNPYNGAEPDCSRSWKVRA